MGKIPCKKVQKYVAKCVKSVDIIAKMWYYILALLYGGVIFCVQKSPSVGIFHNYRRFIMAAKKGNRVKVVLACTECKQRNYDTYTNGKTTTERLEFHKYCRFCKKHTAHKESK